MRFQRIDAWIQLVGTGGIAGAFALTLLWGICFNFASSFWQPVKARVVGIEDFSKSAELRYSYTFDRQEYTGNNFAYLGMSLEDKGRIHRLYPVGSVITVYVM